MSGYYKKSKSNNAVLAEHQQKYPAYKAAKLLKVSTKAIYEILSPCEWHHTSAAYNKTNYYYMGILLKFQEGWSVNDLIELGYDVNEVFDNYNRYHLIKSYSKVSIKTKRSIL